MIFVYYYYVCACVICTRTIGIGLSRVALLAKHAATVHTVIIRLRPIRIIIIIKPRFKFKCYTQPHHPPVYHLLNHTMLLCLYNVYKTHADHPVFESDVRRAFQILFETNNKIPTYNGSFIYDIIKI